MTVLEDYFHSRTEMTFDHPLLRLVDLARTRPDVKKIVVEVLLPRDVLGYADAKLYLHQLDEFGRDVAPYQAEDWNNDLNAALVHRGIPASSIGNEKVRFALELRELLTAPETRFGDGFYNAVLVHHIKNSGFAEYPEVMEVLKYVYRSDIDVSTESYLACKDQIDMAIARCAHELADDLKYEISAAKQVLASAVAQYLDERFSVTNRRMMGLLRPE